MQLQAFHALKRLRINLEYLLPGFLTGIEQLARCYEIHSVLPQSLEGLNLEFWQLSIRQEFVIFPDQQMRKVIHDFIEDIENIARHLSAHLPALTTIGLGYLDLPMPASGPGSEIADKAFNAGGIEIYCYDAEARRGLALE